MNWLLLVVASAGALATPVVAGVVAPGLMTQLAQGGVALQHRHFVFDETIPVRADGQLYEVHLRDGDLYELPLSTQVIVRGAVVPAPDDEALRLAFQQAMKKFHVPVLGYDLERDGSAVTVRATLPAGVLAGLDERYQRLVEKYEA